MAIADVRLRIFTFPQGWNGAEIPLRLLVAPFGNPLQPLAPGLEPFAEARLVLSAHLIPATDQLPRPADVTERIRLEIQTPPDIGEVYSRLATQFDVDPAAPSAYVPPAKTRFLKMLMPSYLEASGFASLRTDLAVTDDRYVCALVDGERPTRRPPRPPAPPKWDAVLAMAIRQPVLAERLGLLHVSSVRPPDGSFYANGGWLYVTLHETSDYFTAAVAPDFLKVYAARIPPLRAALPAPVFAPALFPVRPVPPAGSFDDILRESDIYADGFARLVHTFQPDRADYLNLSRQDERRLSPYTETGLKLGWDDEQIVIWLNRQITDDPRNAAAARDTPLGVRGFRVDVREAEGPGPWTSLVRMQGPITIGDLSLGSFDGEMAIELAPSQLQGKRDGEYWLPPYFTQWTGSSLIAADATAFKVANQSRRARVLNPVGDRIVPLRYGQSYQFRVRLTDLTGGGPGPGAGSEPPTGIATCRFRRFVPPESVKVGEPVDNADGTRAFSIARPMLGYPALLYTSLADAEARLLADAPVAAAGGRLPGFPDPDVTRLRIDVTVASLELDPENHPEVTPRRFLFSTFRSFAEDPVQTLALTVEFQDEHDLAGLPAPAATGPIRLPTARGLELTLTPVARPDPGTPAGVADPAAAPIIDAAALDRDDPKLLYFGKHAARVGSRATVTLRREAASEGGLVQEAPGVPFQGIFLRPDPPADGHLEHRNAAAGTRDEAPGSAIQRLARQLRLEHRELTLSAEPGRRAVFGASAAVRHVLSPDHSTITFATETEITAQWLMVIPLRLARDWTWDGLTDEGLRVFRSIGGGARELVGVLSPRKTLNVATVRAGTRLDRSHTDLYFFDAIDPKPAPGAFPGEMDVTYWVMPVFRQPPQPPVPEWTATVHLPMAAPPVQVPRIVSAGIALSPYERDERYAKTEPRSRLLWIEFAEPVANPRDAYFGRVTMYAPDPMLIGGEPARPPGPLEPPLNLDPEPIRSIVPGQPKDASGLTAMQTLAPAGGAGPIRHFLLPLPPELYEASPELFGFFVYEFRVGHAEGWSTAQARFGLPHRVTGIQHQAPVLTCGVARDTTHVRVSAPYATPVANGQIVRAEPPASDLWALLYAQVRLADGSDWRNVLIGRTHLTFPEAAFRGRSGAQPQGVGAWKNSEIEAWLEGMGLPSSAPLSVLAVELLPEPGTPFKEDPLGRDLGQVRVLRASPLTPVPAVCLDA
jgi:hypothetical protein